MKKYGNMLSCKDQFAEMLKACEKLEKNVEEMQKGVKEIGQNEEYIEGIINEIENVSDKLETISEVSLELGISEIIRTIKESKNKEERVFREQMLI